MSQEYDAEKCPKVMHLTREIRNATGYERTPSQVVEALRNRGSRRPSRAASLIAEDRDMICVFARSMKIKGQDDIPTSEELDMNP